MGYDLNIGESRNSGPTQGDRVSGLRRLALLLCSILAVLAAAEAWTAQVWTMQAWAQPRGPAAPPPASSQALPPPPQGTSRGENFSAKPAPQLFASDCTGAGCHRGPQGLAAKGRLGLSSFLREHYTNSRESASALADYLSGVPGDARAARPERPEPGQRSRSAVRPDDAAKPEEGTARPRRSGEPADGARPEGRPETRPEPRPGTAAARAVQRARQQQQATAPEPPPPPPPLPPPEPPKPQVFDIFD
jgi:hypothetical protein